MKKRTERYLSFLKYFTIGIKRVHALSFQSSPKNIVELHSNLLGVTLSLKPSYRSLQIIATAPSPHMLILTSLLYISSKKFIPVQKFRISHPSGSKSANLNPVHSSSICPLPSISSTTNHVEKAEADNPTVNVFNKCIFR